MGVRLSHVVLLHNFFVYFIANHSAPRLLDTYGALPALLRRDANDSCSKLIGGMCSTPLVYHSAAAMPSNQKLSGFTPNRIQYIGQLVTGLEPNEPSVAMSFD